MSNTTVIIPVGPSHHAISQRAIASVHDQTRDTALIVIHDNDQRGPGWARNHGLAQTQTEYVLFLDADDWLTPNAVELLEDAIKPGWYAYGDWISEGRIVTAPAPQDVWGPKTFNIITALVPAATARRVGGFDEQLPGAEDKEFFGKLLAACVCGVHCGKPILNYTADGTRSITFNDRPDYKSMMHEIERRYKRDMACCGKGGTPKAVKPEPIENAVTIEPKYSGKRKVLGPATGTAYGRFGRGTKIEVYPEDWEVMPRTLFREITEQDEIQEYMDLFDDPETQPISDIEVLGNRIFNRVGQPYTPPTGRKRMSTTEIIKLGQRDE